ncbi:F0F1 ATP synthase subunit B [Aurantimonas marina]|uniref:F0F1 ATP synthase subunit B n=1 Tax=Aurantimonas marina TaxID=2780508 RepID=UPI0019D05550|nr:F0F1 ATP synthase subunit B [Aurantimonas marina]
MRIDWWTLGIQTVNVLILVWLLARFFWRPLAAMIETRRKAAAGALAEAEAERGKARAALAEIEKTRAGFAEERGRMVAEAQAAAEKIRADVLAKAEAEAGALRNRARAEIAQEEEASRASWAEHASRLAVDIARRLVSRLDDKALREAFLDSLVAEIGRLSDHARHNLARDGATFQAVSASPLDDEDRERVRTRLAEVLGGNPRLDFTADPKLIAGLELHGSHILVTNSWRADLDRILTELSHDVRD